MGHLGRGRAPGCRVGSARPPGVWTTAGGTGPGGARARDSGILALLGEPHIPSGRARNLVPAWPQVRGPVSPLQSRSAPSDLRQRGRQGCPRCVLLVGTAGRLAETPAAALSSPYSFL